MILILTPFFLPWWVVVLICLALSFYIPNLYEVIVVGLFLDMIYGENLYLFGLSIVFTISLTVSMFLLSKFKSQIFI